MLRSIQGLYDGFINATTFGQPNESDFSLFYLTQQPATRFVDTFAMYAADFTFFLLRIALNFLFCFDIAHNYLCRN